MLAITAKEVARIVGGRVGRGNPDALVTGVAIDTRRLAAGDLFVALPGQQADGHAFTGEALARGAAALLVRESPADVREGTWVVVSHPAAALQGLAAEIRSRLSARVVAITGSSGKTITKELTAAVARTRFRVGASEASFNNEIGVPLTLLAADARTEVIVAEVGSRGRGHIAALMPILRPDVAVVLNVGMAHVGMFGSIDAVAEAKGELIESLSPDGVAVLNADDERVAGMAARTMGRVLTFGTSGSAGVRAEEVALSPDACASFTLVSRGERARVVLRIAGEHLVHDALAAAAVGEALGVSTADAALALSDVRSPAWRMEVVEAAGGWRVVNDAYNANPASMSAALRALAAMGGGRRTWAVLGPMAELGDAEAAEHERIGRLVVRLGIGRLVVVGEAARPILEAALLEGKTPEDATLVPGVEAAIELLRRTITAGDVVLVKASRAAGLERLALAIAGEGAA